MKITARIHKALEVLNEGGLFKNALEYDNYAKRSFWKFRLQDKNGNFVKGVGGDTFYQLYDNGHLTLHNAYTTAKYYKLQKDAIMKLIGMEVV